jgi:hypothetical protein
MPGDTQSVAEAPQCPVCRARFRQQRTCPRCGADLAVLMGLAGESFLARRDARAALRRGDLTNAHDLAQQAQQLCDTPPGRSLLAFAASLRHVLGALGTLEGKRGQEPFPVHPGGRLGEEILWNQSACGPATAGKGS